MFNSKHIRTLERDIDAQNQSIIRMRNELNHVSRDSCELRSVVMRQFDRINELEKYLKIEMQYTAASEGYVKTKE